MKRSKLAFALVFPLLIFVLYRSVPSYLGDTDRYYHFGLSRAMVEQGAFFLTTVPQAEDLGWGDYFPDKEFLFHLLTRVGYFLGGEGGASASVLLAAAGSGIVLFAYGAGMLPSFVAFLCAVSALFSHSLIFRLLMLRPHVLAIFFFLLLSLAILRRRPWLAAFSTAGYVMAYHAFYIPLACLGLAFLASLWESAKERREWNKLFAFSAGGFAIGVLLNPYFPSQLAMGLLVAKIPFLMQGEMKGAQFGMELFPLGAPGMLKFYFFPFCVLLLSARLCRASFAFRYLFSLCLAFGLLAFQTVRAGEYFVPAAGLLLMLALSEIKGTKTLRALAGAIAFLQLGVFLFVARTEASFAPDAALHEQTRQAIAAIPAGPAKVLNCEWDSAAFLLYQRPDLRFADALDPSLLYAREPALHWEREQLRRGFAIDPLMIARGFFRADYVLCRARVVAAQLDMDPAFERVYPTGEQRAEIFLYRSAPSPHPAFARAFSGRLFSSHSFEEAKKFSPDPSGELQELKLAKYAASVEFPVDQKGLSCAHLRVAPGEIRRLAGARYLGLGGGPTLRAWRNGRLLYASGPAFPQARSVQALARLEPPLAIQDRIDLLVCAAPEAAYAGAAVSLWTEQSLANACGVKRKSKKDGGAAASPLFSSDAATCLGPIAAASPPPALR